tara:strand:+ start:527 stop:1519 length:993 start_codon:yes stop_codon:yes gene_type:complete
MKIKAAVIGMGIGNKHLEAIENYKGSIVKIICEKNKNKILRLKKKFPDKIITSNENVIFDNKEINLVSIASYDNYHFSQIVKSIKSNKNIIVEKPMCLNLKELKIISRLLKLKKTKITSNLVLRVNSLFKNFKKKIDKENVFYIEADYLWGRREKLNGWRSKIKDYSITLGAGIHMIDIVMWILNLKPKYVTAYGNDIATKNSKFKKKSFAVYIFEFPKKILVKITANASGIFNHFHEMKIFQKNNTLIHNFNGSFNFKKINKITKVSRLNTKYPDKENRKKLIHNFIDSLLNKDKKTIVSLKEQINLMNICFAADKSLNNGSRIKIKYF